MQRVTNQTGHELVFTIPQKADHTEIDEPQPNNINLSLRVSGVLHAYQLVMPENEREARKRRDQVRIGCLCSLRVGQAGCTRPGYTRYCLQARSIEILNSYS